MDNPPLPYLPYRSVNPEIPLWRGSFPMDTYDLIQAALTAKDAYDAATGIASTAATALQNAAATLTAANQALHDDLAQNGPALLRDTDPSATEATLYAALDPDTYSATPIRVVG